MAAEDYWYSVPGEVLLNALIRAHGGESPGLLMLEIDAHCGTDDDGGIDFDPDFDL